MTDKEKEAIEYFKKRIDICMENANICDDNDFDEEATCLRKEQILTETVLNLIQTHQAEIEKKDKIINSIEEYAQQEIDFATEDIEDYIDDDREGNKDIIGELKEWREHWKDIIRIMNNEKTYIDFEYKVTDTNVGRKEK